MTSASLHTLVLAAAALVAAIAPSAQARPVDCDGTGVAKCVIATERATEHATERIQSGRQGVSMGTRTPNLHAPTAPSLQTRLTGWSPFAVPATGAEESAASLSGDAQPGGDRPYLALLLATVGIVAFMAHRRSGG